MPVSTRKVSLSFLAKRFVAEAAREPLYRHLAWFGAFGPDAASIGAAGVASTLPALWERLATVESPIKRAMLFDLLTYLAENLLTKVDRATMLASVEARAPYLDRLVMEMALRQPVDAGVHRRQGQLGGSPPTAHASGVGPGPGEDSFVDHRRVLVGAEQASHGAVALIVF